MSEPSSQAEPVVINDRCKCSHDRFRHNYDTVDGPCSKPDCDCGAYAPVTVETVELPEPERRCNGCSHHEGEGCGCPEHDFVSVEHCDRCNEAIVPIPAGPLCMTCGRTDGYWFDRSVCAEPCGSMHDRCTNCGAVSGHCPLETPPHPERRPPLTVQYSVAGGHPYEVSIPGDASVTAEDGVLIIKHPSAQILAITRVAPMED